MILKKDEYSRAIDRYFDEAKADIIQRIRHLRKRFAHPVLLERFDIGAKEYGPLDLATTLRDWDDEESKEVLDAVAYRIFRKVLRRWLEEQGAADASNQVVAFRS